jgi:hypothetical protein
MQESPEQDGGHNLYRQGLSLDGIIDPENGLTLFLVPAIYFTRCLEPSPFLWGCQSVRMRCNMHHTRTFWKCGLRDGISEPGRNQEQENGPVFSGQSSPFF